MINKVKPIYRLTGSKYRMLDFLVDKFNLDNIKDFYEPFGGTGIVAVNVKENYKNINVFLNDFDKVLPPDLEKLVNSNCAFNGFGKYSKSAINQFIKKWENGLFEKYEKYNEILRNILKIYSKIEIFMNIKRKYLFLTKNKPNY